MDFTESAAATDPEILRVTLVVRAHTTSAQLTFAPGTKFSAGLRAVDVAVTALQAQRAESRTCPAWRNDLAPDDAGTGERPPFRTGDAIRHKPTGEIWVCAWADPVSGYLSWLGWPPGEAKISDFELVEAASDERHRERLRDLKGSTRRDAARVLRLYGDSDAAGAA